MNIPIESLNFQMLNVGLAHHDGDWNWKNVVSPFTRVYLVIEGEAKLYLPEETVELKPGCMYPQIRNRPHKMTQRSKR